MKKNLKDFNEISFMSAINLAEFSEDKEYELISTAKQTDPRYGEFNFSKEQLEEMATHFNEDIVGTDIPVDENHDPNHKALAWMKKGSARVAPSKKLKGQYSLYAKLERYTPKGMEYMKTGAYRYFSLQIQNKFEKVVEGTKKVFSNVIRSLALTNQPVIKDLAPTFSEAQLKLNNNVMNITQFLELAQNFLKEEKVSQSQLVTLKTLSEGFEGDDKTKADEKVKEAEEKAEPAEGKEGGEGDEGKEGAADPAEKAGEEAAKELSEKLKGKESFNLSEVQDIMKTAVAAALKPVARQLNEVMVGQREKNLSEQVNTLSLSDTQQVGFKPEAKGKVLDFVKTLSDVQAAKYFEIHKDIITSVDLNEYGNAISADHRDANTKLMDMAKELSEKESIELSEAISKVSVEHPELAKKAAECKQF